jgi:chemotaxis signal transduction protein
MIQAKLIDGSVIELAREDAFELLPFENIFRSPKLRPPMEGLLCHRGRIMPVLGPMPAPEAMDKTVNERPWLLLLKGYAQVVQGLPVFDDDAQSQQVAHLAKPQETAAALLNELDELVKAA